MWYRLIISLIVSIAFTLLDVIASFGEGGGD